MNPSNPTALSAEPKSYAEIGMPNFPFPLSRDGANVLSCDGLPFCNMQDFDSLRLLARWKGYSIGNNHLTKFAQEIVDTLNAKHARVKAHVCGLGNMACDYPECGCAAATPPTKAASGS